MKRLRFTVILVSVFLFIVYSCRWCKYKSALNEQGNKWYNSEYINKNFRGKIKTISLFEDNPNKVTLIIDEGKEFDLSYGVTCVDYSFNSFVTTGDSIFKEKNSKLVRIRKENGKYQDFELNFCGKFK